MLALAGCRLDTGLGDDPFGGWPCVPGHQRGTDRGCVAQPVDVVIDGATNEWAGVEAAATGGECLAPPCDGMTPARIEVGVRDPGDNWPSTALHVALDDRSIIDPDVRYLVRFRPTAEYPTELGDITLIINDDLRTWLVGGEEVTLDPATSAVQVAWTLDGFEYESFSWPPVRAAADVAVWSERRVAGTWTVVARASADARFCWWDSGGYDDPCAAVAP